ncbi:Pecanex protein (C-terminus) [Pelomyxa schiedti]|nr:Pecanex protein (C-terminus) [Pelomyxa schiedti]
MLIPTSSSSTSHVSPHPTHLAPPSPPCLSSTFPTHLHQSSNVRNNSPSLPNGPITTSATTPPPLLNCTPTTSPKINPQDLQPTLRKSRSASGHAQSPHALKPALGTSTFIDREPESAHLEDKSVLKTAFSRIKNRSHHKLTLLTETEYSDGGEEGSLSEGEVSEGIPMSNVGKHRLSDGKIPTRSCSSLSDGEITDEEASFSTSALSDDENSSHTTTSTSTSNTTTTTTTTTVTNTTTSIVGSSPAPLPQLTTSTASFTGKSSTPTSVIHTEVTTKPGANASVSTPSQPAPTPVFPESIHTFVDENGELEYYTLPASNLPTVLEPSIPVPLQSALPTPTAAAVHPLEHDPNGIKGGPTEIETNSWTFNIDRLLLLELLDKNHWSLEIFVELLCVCATAWLGLSILEFYSGFGLFMVCFVVAGAQFSVLKAPHPDGFSTTVEARPFESLTRSSYFVIMAVILLLCSYSEKQLNPFTLGFESISEEDITTNDSLIYIYGFTIDQYAITKKIVTVIAYIIPYTPLFFMTGLLPSINTCIYCFFEQANIHVFGGTGSSSFFAVFVEFFRATFICGLTSAIGISWNSSIATLSLYVALLAGLSFLHSRVTCELRLLLPTLKFLSSRRHIASLFQDKYKVASSAGVSASTVAGSDSESHLDRLQKRSTYPAKRLVIDLIGTVLVIFVTFTAHCTGLFHILALHTPYLVEVLVIICGTFSHIILPCLRSRYPLKLFQAPFLTSNEYNIFDPNHNTRVMWFEILGYILCMAEKCIILPVFFMCAINTSMQHIIDIFGSYGGVFLVSAISVKLFNSAFRDTAQSFFGVLFCIFMFGFDSRIHAETLLIDLFVSTVAVSKITELIDKLDFFSVYIAPWKLSWGSAFHAVLQPLSLPHFSFFLVEAAWSTLVSAPFLPICGSVWFISSWVRPVRFWEVEYHSDLFDHSQIKLSESLDVDDTNIGCPDAAFYQHLLYCLQETLQSDIEAGRLGTVHTGDFFLLMSDMLTALVHIISIGNGYTTFQLRGLELKGPICQERELTALNKGEYSTDDWFCCTKPRGPFPKLLTMKDSANFRWCTWEVVNTAYLLNTYSIALLPATPMFNTFGLRKVFIRNFVSSLIYHTLSSPKLGSWLDNPELMALLSDNYQLPTFVDEDSLFNAGIDDDFDKEMGGITFSSYMHTFNDWMTFCSNELTSNRRNSHQREPSPDPKQPSISEEVPNLKVPIPPHVSLLCFAISLLGRRLLVVNQECIYNTDLFLQRVYAILKGDYRVTAPLDEWVIAELSILENVVGKALKTSLRLHQDVLASEDLSDPRILLGLLCAYDEELIVCHEADPLWTQSVVTNTKQLLSLRKHVDADTSAIDFSIVMLQYRYVKFRLVKFNRESVRGLWAGQQQEIVYVGNTNPERGSVQQLNTTARNMVCQACNPPVGIPVFVSPLVTSYRPFLDIILKSKAKSPPQSIWWKILVENV